MENVFTFTEMMQNDGLYTDTGTNFAPGVAFKIEDGVLTLLKYSSVSDLFPNQEVPVISKNVVVNYRFTRVNNINQLFKN